MMNRFSHIVAGICTLGLCFSTLLPNTAISQSSGNTIEVKYQESFEQGTGGWFAENGIWEFGLPSAGPGNAPHGERIAGTILAGEYPSPGQSRLISPSFQLPPVEDIGDRIMRLDFLQWYSLGNGDLGSVQISVNNGPWEDLPGAPSVEGARTDWHRVAVPNLIDYAGEIVRFSFLFEANGSSSSLGWYIDTIRLVLVTPVPNHFEPFEGNVVDWTIENGLWQFGEPTQGPDSSFAGNQVAGTVLDGTYSDTNTRLVSPPIDVPTLTAAQQFKLRFWHWFSFSDGDYGNVSLSVNDSTWIPISTNFTGESGVWSQYIIPNLLDHADAGSQIRIGFELNTVIQGSNKTGWYLDNFETLITERPPLVISTDSSATEVPFADSTGASDWYVDNGVWEIGPPSNASGFLDSVSTFIAGTILDNNYPNGATTRLISPPLRVETASIRIELEHSFSLSERDSALIQLQVDGGEWQNIAFPFQGDGGSGNTIYSIADVVQVNPDFTPRFLFNREVRIGFLFKSKDNGSTNRGWFIGNLEVGPNEGPLVISHNESEEYPESIVLHPNYPNPFNPTTSLAFRLDRAGHVSLTVYDMLGRTIETLVDQWLPAGSHTYQWNAQGAASGLYVYRLESDHHTQSRKMMLLR